MIDPEFNKYLDLLSNRLSGFIENVWSDPINEADNLNIPFYAQVVAKTYLIHIASVKSYDVPKNLPKTCYFGNMNPIKSTLNITPPHQLLEISYDR